MYVCVVQEWAKRYYDASTALKDKESQLDKVAEEIEKVGIIKFNGSSLNVRMVYKIFCSGPPPTGSHCHRRQTAAGKKK